MMRKWMYLSLAALFFAGAAAGCSGSQNTAANGQESAKEAGQGLGQDGEDQAAENGGSGSKNAASSQDAPAAGENSGKGQDGKGQDGKGQEEGDKAPAELASGRHHVVINMENYDPITVEIYADEAPITATNFLKLADEKFYDGLTFHRIISGFMIQGGDPLGNGMGGSDETIKGEFAANGVENPLSHTRGAISMARSQFPDSASSQFFIVHEDSAYLDGNYAVFGYVTEGMETVDQICADTQVEDSNGTVLPENQPVIQSIEVID